MQVADRPSGDVRTLSRNAESLERTVIPAPKFPWKTRLLLPGVVLFGILALVGYTAKDALWPARSVRVVPVVVKAGSDAAASTTIQAPGWVEADPYSVAVSALADGIVSEVLALEGQQVRRGDVVARMIDDDARLVLARAEAELEERRARLDAAQRTWDNPTEVTRAVATTTALVAETQAELEKLTAEIAAETAKLTSLKLEAERTADAFKQQASSEVEAVRLQQQYQVQIATADAIRGQRAVLEARLSQHQADLVAAKENLRLRINDTRALAEAKAQLALAKAMRDESALRLTRMEIRSPADGIVMQRLTSPGAKLVMNMDHVYSATVLLLYDPQHLQVRVDVPLTNAAKVGVGQEARIVVSVAPDRTFSGKVTRIVNEADIQKNTLQVKVAILDPIPDLKPEMLARVLFLVRGPATKSTSSQTVFAPVELIERDGDQAYAWIVDGRSGIATRRTLKLGSSEQSGWVAVASGLVPGDQVIADYSSLREGQRVRVAGEARVSEGGNHGAH